MAYSTNKPLSKERELDLIQKINVLVSNGEKVNKSELGREFGIYYKTVDTILEKHGIKIPDEARIKTKKKNIKIKSTSSISLQKISIDSVYSSFRPLQGVKIVKASLCKDRHDCTEEYNRLAVFPTLTTSQMFNFVELEKIANHFIDVNIHFDENGEAEEFLKVVATGLQICNDVLYKVCQDRHVPLTKLHYNIDDGKYYQYDVIRGKEIKNKNEARLLKYFGKNTSKVFIDKDLSDEDLITDELFVVSISQYKLNSSIKVDNGKIDEEIYVTKNPKKAFEVYSDRCLQLLGTTDHYGIFIDQYNTLSEIRKESTISKSYTDK